MLHGNTSSCFSGCVEDGKPLQGRLRRIRRDVQAHAQCVAGVLQRGEEQRGAPGDLPAEAEAVGAEIAEKEKLEFLSLEVRTSNLPARRLYESEGYVHIGARPGFYTNPREDGEIYTKRFGGSL